MGFIIFGVMLLIAAIALPKTVLSESKTIVKAGVSVVLVALGVMMFFMTSYINVPDNTTAHLTRLYMGKSLPTGKVIAVDGEMGKQSKIVRQGFHFDFMVRVLNDVDYVNDVVIPPNKLGIVSARDGIPMPVGQTFADKISLDMILDADLFMKTGGQKGPQTTIIPPGTWPINQFLFEIKLADATEVEQGMVAVIKSNSESSINFGDVVVSSPESCEPVDNKMDENALSNRLVPVGCVGIWNDDLPPNRYYINPMVYKTTMVDTRQQAWEYQGGYHSRSVALTVDSKGDITQVPSGKDIERPATAKDGAIAIKIDGYTIYQNVRALIQITPQNAPFIVASVGGMDQVEDRVITPAIQSSLRDLAGKFITLTEAVIDAETGKPTLEADGTAKTRRVRRPIEPMDFVEHRDLLQDLVESDLVGEALKAGVTLREVRFLNSDIPPEVLIPRKRKQLAFQMKETLIEEEKAQLQRVAREKAAATADRQADLVKAEIAVKKAEQVKLEKKALGEAERLYLTELAMGEKARTEVLGADRVMTLKMTEIFLQTLAENPELVKLVGKLVPEVMVTGDAGGAGSMAVLAKGLRGSPLASLLATPAPASSQ